MQLSSDTATRNAQLKKIKDYVELNLRENQKGAYNGSTLATLNSPAEPVFYVWKSASPLEESGGAILLSDISRLNATDVERLRAVWAIRSGGFRPESQDDRAIFGQLFFSPLASGTRDSLLAAWQRPATVAEMLLADGDGTRAVGLETDGTPSSGSPAVLGEGAEGLITAAILRQAESAT